MASIKSFVLIQGDSSNVYNFSSTDYPDFSDVNWVGGASIRSVDINGAEALSIALTKSDGSDGNPVGSRFVFQINPTDSATLAPGRYHLSVEIKNLSLGFRREVVQIPFSVTASGVTN